MLKRIGVAAVAAMVVGVGASANAGTIFTATTQSGCSNCFGLTYTLTVGDAADATATTFDASLKVTGTLTDGGNVTRISGVSFKVADDVIPPLLLTAAPNDTSNWKTSESNANNAGCEGGGNGFVCSQAKTTAGFANVTGGPVDLMWAWTFSLAAGKSPSALHIGAKLNNAAGNLNGRLLSQSNFTVDFPPPPHNSVPDGGVTLLLLGVSLAGIGLARNRMP